MRALEPAKPRARTGANARHNKGMTGTRKREPQLSPSPELHTEKRAIVMPVTPTMRAVSARCRRHNHTRPGMLSSNIGE